MNESEIELKRKQLELLRLQEKYLDLELKEKQYIEENLLEFFEPWEHQQKILDYLHQGKKTILLQGANRIGKTTLITVILAASCLGYEPWSGKKSIFGGKPIRARLIGVDWEHHIKEVIVPSFYKFFPKGTYETKKNNVGVEYLWRFNNGSVIQIMVHKQDTREHEGWSGHLVVFDEPPPHDKFTANIRGLVDTSGVCIMAFTAVYEKWILDELVLSDSTNVACVTEVPITANPNLKQEDIEEFSKNLTEEERKARIEGKWIQLEGRVFPEFDKQKHLIDPFEIPLDWPVVAMIDLHPALPQAVGFYAVDPHNIAFVIDEIWENCTVEELADMIKRRKEDHKWRLEKAYIDPLSKGDKNYFKNRGIVQDSFSIISDSLRQNGILLEVASKDKSSGIRNVRQWLKGPNGIPVLYFFYDLPRHIYEIQRWVYDPKTGKPIDEDDHFCENLYRFTLTGTKYTSPSLWTEKLPLARPGV